MRTVLVKITAHLTKDGLKTVKREVVGYTSEGADQRLERLAGILVDLIMKPVRQTEKEVAASD